MIIHKNKIYMKYINSKIQFPFFVLTILLSLGAVSLPTFAQQSSLPLEDRLLHKIALDVRSMNIVDIIKSLAQKGEFSVVTSPSVTGQSTLVLNDVTIKDALNIIAVSNRIAYHIDNDIVNIMTAAEYEALYGKPFNDATKVTIIHLQYSKPSFILAALEHLKSNVGKIIIDEDTGSVILIDTPGSTALMQKAISQMERPLETITYALKYAQADSVVEQLRSRIDAKGVGSISGDIRANKVIARVFPGRRNDIEHLISALDKPMRQVLIDFHVIQVTLKLNTDQGIDWSLLANSSAGKNKLKILGHYTDSKIIADSNNTASNFSQIGFGTVGAGDFAAALQSLDQVSDTRIVSSPQILATNNEEAKIHVGDTVPYIVTSITGSGNASFTTESPRFIDVGLKLAVLPLINEDGMITMRLRPELATVTGRIESRQGGIPQVNTTTVETQVMVQDGTSIIMAGLRKEEHAHTKKGLSKLMDIAYLGSLFSNTSDIVTSTETVILITPHIVKPSDNLKKIAGTIKPQKN